MENNPNFYKININITKDLEDLKADSKQYYGNYIDYDICKFYHEASGIRDKKNRFGLMIYLFSQTDNFKKMIQEWELVEVLYHKHKCVCSKKIYTCVYMRNKYTGITIVIGTTCALKHHLINEADVKQINKDHRSLKKYKKRCKDCGEYKIRKTSTHMRCNYCHWISEGCPYRAMQAKIQEEMEELSDSAICLFSSIECPEI